MNPVAPLLALPDSLLTVWTEFSMTATVDASLATEAVGWLELGVHSPAVAYLAGLSRSTDPVELADRLQDVGDELDLPDVGYQEGMRALVAVTAALLIEDRLPFSAAGPRFHALARIAYERGFEQDEHADLIATYWSLLDEYPEQRDGMEDAARGEARKLLG